MCEGGLCEYKKSTECLTKWAEQDTKLLKE